MSVVIRSNIILLLSHHRVLKVIGVFDGSLDTKKVPVMITNAAEKDMKEWGLLRSSLVFASFGVLQRLLVAEVKKRCKEKGNVFAPIKIIRQGKPPHLAVGNATFPV